jgi:lactoylglutathione lyase
MTASLALLALRTEDLNRARDFYSVLGLSFESQQHGTGPVHYCSTSPAVALELYPLLPKDTPTTSTRIGFRVPDVDGAFQALCQAGAGSVSPPRASPWGRRAVVSDPDGHRVELLAADA